MDRLIANWKRERPDYNLAPVEIIGRAGRVMELVDRALESKFEEWGITRASFDVLASLRRTGAPYRLLQRDLMRQLMRTSGSISLRIDALEREGLVQRESSKDDRRSTYVRLTGKGAGLLEKVIPEHLANEAELLSGLTVHERETLTTLLRKWLNSLESDGSNAGQPELGIVMLSPQASLAKRRAAGLPDVAGMLIHRAEGGGRAEAAGLRRGDLITHIDAVSITGLSAVRKAMSKPQQKVRIFSILRGAEQHTFRIDCRKSRS